MPTLSRTRPSSTPRAGRTSAGMLACVIVAGWPISDSTPPRLSARLNSRVRVRSRWAAVAASLEPDADHAAEVAHLAAGHVVVGMVGQAGIVNAVHLRLLGQPRGERAGVGAMPLHADRQRLDAAQHQPGIERAGHAAGGVLVEGDRLEQVAAADRPRRR